MKHIGFTGTRHGCKPAQLVSLTVALGEADKLGRVDDLVFAHHGDCIGADAQFHEEAQRYGWVTIGHIPEDKTHRAFCTFTDYRAPLPHMKRNKAIVAESDVMIACPFDMAEKTVGGTWKTIGFTRKSGKPLAIVWPDGRVTYERWP